MFIVIHSSFIHKCLIQHAVSVPDRVSGQEGLVLAFLHTEEIPFTKAPKIIELAKQLARDPAALQKLSLDRTTASYKSVYGLGLTLKDTLVGKLQETYFSLNVDESTSTSKKERVSLIVHQSDFNITLMLWQATQKLYCHFGAYKVVWFLYQRSGLEVRPSIYSQRKVPQKCNICVIESVDGGNNHMGCPNQAFSVSDCLCKISFSSLDILVSMRNQI